MTSCEFCTTQWATGARPDLAAHWVDRHSPPRPPLRSTSRRVAAINKQSANVPPRCSKPRANTRPCETALPWRSSRYGSCSWPYPRALILALRMERAACAPGSGPAASDHAVISTTFSSIARREMTCRSSSSSVPPERGKRVMPRRCTGAVEPIAADIASPSPPSIAWSFTTTICPVSRAATDSVCTSSGLCARVLDRKPHSRIRVLGTSPRLLRCPHGSNSSTERQQ
jgi:hypothetical protein